MYLVLVKGERMVKYTKGKLVFTDADYITIRDAAKKLGVTKRQLIYDALARGLGYENHQELKDFKKAEVIYELANDGTSSEVPECLGRGVADQLDAQMFELDEV